ncbi:MAG TPA: AMP-binding protein [Solirubrobacter sp.]|nr:AMP-binding protein [Solirubrobacter sp.]
MPETIPETLCAGAKPALIDPDGPRTWSRDDLRAVTDRLAGQLAAAGVEPGTGVGIVLPHGPGAVVAFLAAARAGAVALPLNPQLQPAEMRSAFEDCPPRLVIAQESDAAAAAAEALGCPLRALTADLELEDGGTHPAPPAPSPDAVALLLHTSGTTGRPKAVPLRQRNLVASARSIARTYGLGPDDRSYCVMPLFHVHGLVASTLAALAGGGAVVVPARVRTSVVWEHAAEHGVTWLSAVPTILTRLPDRPAGGGGPLRFLRSCSSALAPAVWERLEARCGVPVVEAYGMTEAAHQMTSNRLPPGERRPGTVGVSAGAEVAIVDAAWRPLPVGEAGEVTVRGPGVVDGYLANPEANAASFRDGWFRTGDIGRLDAAGCLVLEGRIKELINRGGEKIAPREIDEALLAFPGVRDAVAYGVADAKYGEVVHAAVVGPDLDDGALRAHLQDRLAPFKVPRRIRVVAEIPKGPTGKVQRRLLADLLET